MLTKQLSDFLHGLRYEDLPEQAVDQAKMCVEDLVGVAVAGSARPQGEIWRGYFFSLPQRPESTAWDGRWNALLCEYAAALNAAYAHVIDMDDVHNASITHLGAVTIPAALAVGQKYHRSGKEVLTAIAAGYEAGARIGQAINPGSYHYWHTTGVVGSFSSAVAAGKLLGLNQQQMLNAVGSAGTQSAGLWQFIQDGAMSKTLHTANATLCGIRAAQLAALGFTAAQDILGGKRGFLGAMTGQSHPELLVQDLGRAPYRIQTNSFKPYACCRHTHSANYCVELLKQERPIDPERIVRITDYTYQVAKDNVDAAAPATPYAFKFSVQYCIAAQFLYGALTEAQFSAEKTGAPALRRLMDKTTVAVDPALEAMYQADHNCWPHRLEVELEDGCVLVRQVEYPFGDFHNPFQWSDAHSKFLSLTQGLMPREQAEEMIRRFTRLDALEDVNLLFPAPIQSFE